MNESALIKDIQRKFDLLPISVRKEVLDLLRAEMAPSPLAGPTGKELLRFGGAIEKGDLALMERAIKEECEKVDSSEW